MTHGTRGNFLAFQVAPPRVQNAGPEATERWSWGNNLAAKGRTSWATFCPLHRSRSGVPAVAPDDAACPWETFAPHILHQKKLETLLWKHFFPSSGQKEPKPALLVFSTPKVSNAIACFANSSRLCDALDESVLLRADILGTHWRAIRPCKNVAVHQKHVIEINVPQNWTQTLRRGR